MVRELPDEVTNQLREDIGKFLVTRPDLRAADLGNFTPLSQHTVRAFMNGTIPGGRQVVGQLQNVLKLAKAGEILIPGGQSSVVVAEEERKVRRVAKRQNFYETQTVRRVAEVLNYCAENAEMGVITGTFGIGKSEAVKAWRRRAGRKIDSVIFEFTEFSCSNKLEFVRCLAMALSVPVTLGSQYGGRVFQDICEHLREHPTTIILDQCENTQAKCFQVARQIWDATRDSGVGVVILAAPVLLQRLNKSGMADLGALSSRVSIWAPLSGLTKGEMAAIVRQEGVRDVDEAAFDLWWKATGGSMRRLIRSLNLIQSRHANKRITEKTITGVVGHLWGMSLGN